MASVIVTQVARKKGPGWKVQSRRWLVRACCVPWLFTSSVVVPVLTLVLQGPAGLSAEGEFRPAVRFKEKSGRRVS